MRKPRTVVSPPAWIEIRTASEMMGRSYEVVWRMAKSGALTTQQFPGTRVLVSKVEIERLVAEAVRPGTLALAAAS